jgi:hypothetical protein
VRKFRDSTFSVPELEGQVNCITDSSPYYLS